MIEVSTINFVLALGTLGLQLMAVALVAVYFLRKQFPDLEDIAAFLRKHGIGLGFVLSIAAIGLTLLYSDILGFEPCPLCWWQRVFLYPQALLFGLALWKPELKRAACIYSLWLSVPGALVALYHHALQMFPAGALPCPATGPSCAQITLLEFGYVTFPMMALSLFAFLIVIVLFARKSA